MFIKNKLLNTNNQILFVTDDILSDEELTIQYAFMQNVVKNRIKILSKSNKLPYILRSFDC